MRLGIEDGAVAVLGGDRVCRRCETGGRLLATWVRFKSWVS